MTEHSPQSASERPSQKTGFSLQALVDDLSPVNPLRLRDGLALMMAVTLFVAVLVNLFMGLRSDLFTGNPHPVFVARTFLMLMLGVGAGYSALSHARPDAAGKQRSDHIWSVALLVGIGLVTYAISDFINNMPTTMVDAGVMLNPWSARECLTYSLSAAFAIAAAMTIWLRRGAVVAIERTAWLTGLAAGGFGAASYSLHCPFNGILYSALWFPLAIAGSALLARLILPRCLRW